MSEKMKGSYEYYAANDPWKMDDGRSSNALFEKAVQGAADEKAAKIAKAAEKDAKKQDEKDSEDLARFVNNHKYEDNTSHSNDERSSDALFFRAVQGAADEKAAKIAKAAEEHPEPAAEKSVAKPATKANFINVDDVMGPSEEKPAETPANTVNWIDADDPEDPSTFTIKERPGSIFLDVVDRNESANEPAKEPTPEPETPDEAYERMVDEAKQRQKEADEYFEDFGPNEKVKTNDEPAKAETTTTDKDPAQDPAPEPAKEPTPEPVEPKAKNEAESAPANQDGDNTKAEDGANVPPDNGSETKEKEKFYNKAEIIAKIKEELEKRRNQKKEPEIIKAEDIEGSINEAKDDADDKDEKEKKPGLIRRILNKLKQHHWGFSNPRSKNKETAKKDEPEKEKTEATKEGDSKKNEADQAAGEKHEAENSANGLARDIYAALAEANDDPAKLLEATARAMAYRDASGLLNNRITYSSDANRSFERTNLENAIQSATWQFSRGNWGALQRRRTEIMRELLNIER